MDMNDVKTGAEIVKDSSEALKNFQEIIGKFLEPRGIDAAVIEGHKKIIEDYVAREDIDEFTNMFSIKRNISDTGIIYWRYMETRIMQIR